jgi:gluconolactonase
MTALRVLVAAVLLSLPVSLAGQTIFPSDVKVEHLFDGGVFTEGPVEGPDSCLYFSDIARGDSVTAYDGHIWRLDPKTHEATIFRSPSGLSNGLEFDREWNMLIASGSDFGGRGISRVHGATGKGEILASRFHGEQLNSPNDLTVDSRGRIFFTDPRYGKTATVRQPCFGVYRIDPDKHLSLITDVVGMPNGIALSPDERILYVACCDEGDTSHDGRPARAWCMQIQAFDLRDDGSLEHGRVLIDFQRNGAPDGFTVDASGNLYIAVRSTTSPRIEVYSPAGVFLARVQLPENPTNAAFGRGARLHTLFVTAGHSVYAVPTLNPGTFAK